MLNSIYQLRTFVLKKTICVFSVPVFIFAIQSSVYAQSSDNKGNNKPIDKSKLVIHENFRDEQPQHFNNSRNVIAKAPGNYHSKAAGRTKVSHLGNISKSTDDKAGRSHKTRKPIHKSHRKARKNI